MTEIMVGVDGSEPARRALEWAVGEAAIRGRRVHAVYAVAAPVTAAGFAASGAFLSPELSERAEAEAERLLEDVIASVEVPEGVVFAAEAVFDLQPSHALITQSSHADMLVVGSRGRGGFTGLLLGSVSQQCVQHARCPVVVIPSKPEDLPAT
jgi:nucleotide-binding universal stress UspA family protein